MRTPELAQEAEISKDATRAPSREEIAASAARVLASSEFAASAQLSRFLRYVVENGAEGQSALLKESAIGINVFHRGPGYDPKADPIVRVEARRLRARLEAYYRKGGANDPVRISLPKGGYIPVFEWMEPPPPVAEAPSSPAIAVPPEASVSAATHRRSHRFAWIALSLFAIAAVAIVAYRMNTPDRIVSRFWSSILDGDRPALLIPADSALVMLQGLVHQPVQLPEYMTGEYRTRLVALSRIDQDLVSSLARRRYTSIADLEFASSISHRPEAARRGVLTRYARDVRGQDLNAGNLILLGARHSNPWVELFEKDATFRLDHDEQTDAFRVINTRPQAGESAEIVTSRGELQREIYAIVTYHRNREGSGSVLVIAGASVAGTEAAADFMLDDSRLRPWLHKARVGGEFRGFDILLHARNLAGSAPRADVAAFHIERP
jgi:hypothetical protein